MGLRATLTPVGQSRHSERGDIVWSVSLVTGTLPLPIYGQNHAGPIATQPRARQFQGRLL
jgi:hypothetical protein